jgi:hypothetical protein
MFVVKTDEVASDCKEPAPEQAAIWPEQRSLRSKLANQSSPGWPWQRFFTCNKSTSQKSTRCLELIEPALTAAPIFASILQSMPESSAANEDDVIVNQIALQYADLTNSLPSILNTFLGGSVEGKAEEGLKDDIEPQESSELSVVATGNILIAELT